MFVVLMAALYVASAVGLMLLQAFLSRRSRKWPALILPGIFFLTSFLYPLNMATPPDGVTGDFIIRLVLSWLMGNIPTFILIGMYFVSRQDHEQKNANK